MRLHTVELSLLAYGLTLVSATALTYQLDASEKACFYSYVDSPPAKIAFYFAVSIFDYSVMMFGIMGGIWVAGLKSCVVACCSIIMWTGAEFYMIFLAGTIGRLLRRRLLGRRPW